MPQPPPPPVAGAGAVPDAVDVLSAAEGLARSSHEAWVRERLAEGWSTGDRLDDNGRHHPALVPFEALPDTERARLRQIAVAAVGSLAAAGYRLGAPPIEAAAGGVVGRTEVEFERQMLDAAAAAPDLPGLLAIWRSQEMDAWAHMPDACSQAAERFVQLGEPLAAYDGAAYALKQHPTHVRLRQILALALARSGASHQANAILQRLYSEGHRDEETVGLLGRTHKDLAADTADEAERDAHLREAYRYYAAAYELTAGYWTGINAATMATVLGRRDEAVALARKVRDQADAAVRRAEAAGKDLYWPLATRGEAALIIGDLAEAEALYQRAAEVGRRRFADLHASRRNACLLLRHLPYDGTFVERCLSVPSVVVFTGYMIDRPDAVMPRFPPELEEAVRAALFERLKSLDAGFGYASAACGSDILFLESMLALHGEAHVVLPYDASKFIWDNVETVPGADWGVRFAHVLERASEVVVSSSQRLQGGDVSYEYADLFLYGLGHIRSQQLETSLKTVAVWDGAPGSGPGRTIERWRALGHQVEIVDLRALRRMPPVEIGTGPPSATAVEAATAPATTPTKEFAPEIRALLFADAVGFSKLDEDEVPLFVHHFLGLVGELVASAGQPPILRNTWGDGLYFVFPDVGAAAHFALDLSDRIAATDWGSKGLPPLSLRIGLHAGPVYACMDPVTGRPNYVGAQVSRAARIEPITPPGQVYASQAFAALAAAAPSAGFRCEYVGQTGLAKNYGTYPTFVVRRTARAEPR
jgi:class 3 adenylate cyclase